MVLENISYVPTLAIRASEMKGLEFLPGATKDRMVPCILLAPWASSHTLDRAITRVERAFHGQNYFLTPDPDYVTTNDQSSAQQEFISLFDSANCYGNWRSFVSRHENVWPCVQYTGLTANEIQLQILAFQDMERPYALRLTLDALPQNLEQIVEAFAQSGTADYTIILEGGWTPDPLSLSAQFYGLISETFNVIDASIPVVCSCTSIPKVFSNYNDTNPCKVEFSNRQLIEQVSRNTNRGNVVYGDWGSTRPRENSGFANRPLDRVDYPTDNAWHIARNKGDEWDFRDAAIAIVNSPYWDGQLGIWGEEQIQQTTINSDLGINSPQKNVAARVNIHLHRQAFYGHDIPNPLTFEEDWQD